MERTIGRARLFGGRLFKVLHGTAETIFKRYLLVEIQSNRKGLER